MKTTPLSLDLIRLDGDTQSRLDINPETVEDYAEILTAAQSGEWPFPPLDVFYDGTTYFASDGFHRCLGARQAGRSSAPCVIHEGTAKDARIFGMTANDRHGLRMTRWEKRSNVEWLLDNGGKMPQKEIAQKAGVCERLVRSIVSDRKPKLVPQPPPAATNRQIAALQPAEGDSDPSDWSTTDEMDRTGEFEEPTPMTTGKPPAGTTPDKPSKPPKQYDRSAWFKQWQQSIGPLCRLVDKIAHELGESKCMSQNTVQDHLNVATEEMMEWLGVKR